MRHLAALALAVLGGLAGAPSAHAQRPGLLRSGVLLGLAEGRTLWIAPDSAGTVRILQIDSLLVVPRADGFWKVVSSEGPGSGGLPLYWGAARLDGPAPALGDTGGPDDPGLEREVSVTFLAPNYVALSEHYESYASLPVNGTVAGVDSFTALASGKYAAWGALGESALPLDSAVVDGFGPECTRQYRAADTELELDAESMARWASDYWLIARSEGRWRLVWRFSVGTGAGRGFVFDCYTPYVLPASVVGHDALRPAWREIARQVPGATDAVAAPNGDLVVVLTGTAVRAFRPHGRRLGPAVAEVRASDPHVVMAQWATGKHVARWTRALAGRLSPVRGGER